MATLKELIDALKEIVKLDKRNSKAKVYIGGKYLFIRQENQDNAYFIEL